MFFTSTIGVAIVARRGVDVQIDVGVDAQAAFLHVAVGDAQVGEQQLELGQIGLGFGRRAHVGLADDFQQRRAGPVQIDAAVGLAGQLVVHALAGVFFQVGPDDADPLRLDAPLGIADFEPAVVAERQIVLADLIALGQVGIVIVLAVPLGEGGDLAVQRHRGSQAQGEGLGVHHRQRAGHADADRAGLRVGGRAELGAAAAEQLGPRGQLHVDFESDHDGVCVAHVILDGSSYLLWTSDWRALGFTFSLMLQAGGGANRSLADTCGRRAAAALPRTAALAVAGRSANPPAPKPQGKAMPPTPARLALTVYKSTRYIDSGSFDLFADAEGGAGRDRAGDQIDLVRTPGRSPGESAAAP